MGTVVLEGLGFGHLPVDAVGIYSADNNDPLHNQYATEVYRTFRITERTDTMMVLVANQSFVVRDPVYLSAILSSDRETVYWVNNTKPLP